MVKQVSRNALCDPTGLHGEQVGMLEAFIGTGKAGCEFRRKDVSAL